MLAFNISVNLKYVQNVTDISMKSVPTVMECDEVHLFKYNFAALVLHLSIFNFLPLSLHYRQILYFYSTTFVL